MAGSETISVRLALGPSARHKCQVGQAVKRLADKVILPYHHRRWRAEAVLRLLLLLQTRLWTRMRAASYRAPIFRGRTRVTNGTARRRKR
jgi:hypothetical protein